MSRTVTLLQLSEYTEQALQAAMKKRNMGAGQRQEAMRRALCEWSEVDYDKDPNPISSKQIYASAEERVQHQKDVQKAERALLSAHKSGDAAKIKHATAVLAKLTKKR